MLSLGFFSQIRTPSLGWAGFGYTWPKLTSPHPPPLAIPSLPTALAAQEQEDELVGGHLLLPPADPHSEKDINPKP